MPEAVGKVEKWRELAIRRDESNVASFGVRWRSG